MAGHTKRLTISFTLENEEIDRLNAAMDDYGFKIGGHDSQTGEYENRSYFIREILLAEALAEYSEGGDNNE